ncbi:MAG TPA: 4-alpha-glucanotransferase [Gemmatimonadales bacterium]|nr:4-alpha-glucanotransferase [Gemmatimonadales bacterium]
MTDLTALHALAAALGVETTYHDGLGRTVVVSPETLVRICAALGAPIREPADAADALWWHHERAATETLPAVLVAWDGEWPDTPIPDDALVTLESGAQHLRRVVDRLPLGYHRVQVEQGGEVAECTVVAAPVEAYRAPGSERGWGVSVQVAAIRSSRSRSVGDLRDLEALCRWVGAHGGNVVTVLPLLPTFNHVDPEPSPYSAVSRLYWSELLLDLGVKHLPTAAPELLNVTVADAEVRAALADEKVPEALLASDPELLRYGAFRGAQQRMGRNWRDWPEAARGGRLSADQIDLDEMRYHLVAQAMLRAQLGGLRERLDASGFRLGLDLAVGVHPDGYDAWSRQSLFVAGMSVGAPPDPGFPSGQDWGFAPLLPEASRREGHAYLAAAIGHQMELAGVLRVDHVMAWARLYWIPHGMALHEGTYVRYPAEELFAVLTLESHRHKCEVVGENLGTVPASIAEALPRHGIRGMYLAQFAAMSPEGIRPPGPQDVAMVGTHDTPTFAGWLEGADIDDRLRTGLLAPEAEADVRAERAGATSRLAELLGVSVEDPMAMLTAVLEWLGTSESPLVVPWLEDCWLERRGVNLPGTRASEWPNWQRPMARLLDEVMNDPQVRQLLRDLDVARRGVR